MDYSSTNRQAEQDLRERLNFSFPLIKSMGILRVPELYNLSIPSTKSRIFAYVLQNLGLTHKSCGNLAEKLLIRIAAVFSPVSALRGVLENEEGVPWYSTWASIVGMNWILIGLFLVMFGSSLNPVIEVGVL